VGRVRTEIKRYAGTSGTWTFHPIDHDRRATLPRGGTRAPRLFGVGGAIVCGYTTAAELASWRITKARDGKWWLRATAKRIDTFLASKARGLLFTAPREKTVWGWPLAGPITITGTAIAAVLGEPER
jgi:hypothetical protein